MNKNQETQFTAFLREKAKEADRAIHYRPNYFLNMLETDGGLRTVLKLLSANQVSKGFTKLWEHGRLDLSVEALVVESEWQQAFDPLLITLAEKKLKNVGYPFTRWTGNKTLSPATAELASGAIEVAQNTRKNRVVIDWPIGSEYIDIDLNTLGEDSYIYHTKQTYHEDNSLDIYEVSSAIRLMDDGRYEIKIRYEEAKNPEITDSWWGETHIVLSRDTSTGVAFWYDQDDKRHNGGFPFQTIYELEDANSQQWTVEDLELKDRPDLDETVKQVLRNERRGQRIFRERVLLREPACRLTGVDNLAHLRASHIKPWSESNHRERLDGSNGLMLAPHVDHLFDRAYISFADDGNLLTLNDEIDQLLRRWGIDPMEHQFTSKPFNPQQCTYLAHHRQRFALLKKQYLPT